MRHRGRLPRDAGGPIEDVSRAIVSRNAAYRILSVAQGLLYREC